MISAIARRSVSVAARSATVVSRNAPMPSTMAPVGRSQQVITTIQRRNMGGGHGAGEPHVSKPHTIAGEVFGFVAWFWIFYR
jgi:hypothetical protein